ncbi:MAG TPA: hypothetical protein VII11_08205 [Bacteroidota bacterium]
MNTKLLVLMFFFLINTWILFCQNVVPGNRIDLTVSSNGASIDSNLVFIYKLRNGVQAEQDVYEFSIITATGISIRRANSPQDWKLVSFHEDFLLIRWLAEPEDEIDAYKNPIKPGNLLEGFSIESQSLPGIIIFYAEGDHPLPSFPEGMAPDSIPGYDDLTPFGPGVVGKTIGPVSLPDPVVPEGFLDTLLSYTTQSRSLGWITMQSTADKYTGYFTSAKSNVQANNINAARATLQQVLTDVNVDSASTLTSEAYALLRYNTEYLLSQLPEQESGMASYSLFATHSMHLQQNSDVYSGDIGVNAAGSPPFLDSQIELSIGIGTTTPTGYSVKANRIKVKSGSVVNSNVYYNELDNNGTITGSQNTPLTLPLVATLPELKSATPGTENFDIPQNGTLTLAPGNYGDIMVRKNGVLTLTGGTYHFNSWNTGDDVQVIFQASSEVRIAGKFDSGQGSYIGPQDTTTLSADQIIFYVAGINGTNGNLGATPKAAKIGIGNTVWANFYAPNGTLWIRQNSEARGQFIGKDVDVGIGVKIRR